LIQLRCIALVGSHSFDNVLTILLNIEIVVPL
jgi:hypothetical protein